MNDDDELSDFLGLDLASEVARCAAARGWSIRLPAQRWRSEVGYTDAVLATLIVNAGRRSQQLVLKATPPRPDAAVTPEPDREAYRQAELDCPEGFRPHLVLRAHPPWFSETGGMLNFQRVAGDDPFGVRALNKLSHPQLRSVLAHISRDLLASWNTGALTVTTKTLAPQELLRRRVGSSLCSQGSMHRWAAAAALLQPDATWIAFDDDPDRVWLNPLSLAQASTAMRPIDLLVGRSHGDLHLGNVLVPVRGDLVEIEKYQFVDLDGYRNDRELSADPVCLLLSAVAAYLPDMVPQRWDDLLEALRRPDAIPGPGGDASVDLVEAVFATTAAAVRELNDGWSRIWAEQIRLSTLVGALTFTTYSGISPKVRWWYFRLAARLATDLVGASPPKSARLVHNPFLPPRQLGPGLVQPAALPPLVGSRRVDRLVGHAWSAAADPDQILRDAAQCAITAGDAQTAVALLRGLIWDAATLVGADAPITLALTHDLAEWEWRAGDPVAALRRFEDVWRRRRANLGSNDPDTDASFRAAHDDELNRQARQLTGW